MRTACACALLALAVPDLALGVPDSRIPRYDTQHPDANPGPRSNTGLANERHLQSPPPLATGPTHKTLSGTRGHKCPAAKSSGKMQNGGLSSGVAVGYPCEGSECEDGLFCDLGCCVQKCNTDSGQRKNGLCLCTAHEDCFSFNCEGGLCQMQERMHHSEEKEAELRAWHDTLMREEALDSAAMHCSSGTCTLNNIDLAVVLAFPIQGIDAAELNLRSWNMPAFLPCQPGWSHAKHVDLVIAVAVLGGKGAIVKQRLEGALSAGARQCIRSVLVIDLKLTAAEDTYDHAPPAMFHAALNSTALRDKHYNYMFWMEADTFGVRPGWLQALYQLAVVEQGAWMVGSLQQHNRKMYGHNDYYHINGNALHRFDSEAYRAFLRRARLAHPNVFDYAVMIERMQGGAAHAHVGQMVTHRFKYTKVIQNHPADVCMKTLEDFLRRHPSTFMVHSKALTALLLCSDCCGTHGGGMWSPWKRESTRYSAQMMCLYANSGVKAKSLDKMCDVKAMSALVYSSRRRVTAVKQDAAAVTATVIKDDQLDTSPTSDAGGAPHRLCANKVANESEFSCTKDALYTELLSLDTSAPSLHQRAAKEGYTIAISSFSRDASLANNALEFAKCPYVKQIDIVWHDPNRTPPGWLKAKLQDSRIQFREQTSNLLTNRFRSPLQHASTDAIFSVDDDRLVPCERMTEGFLLWLHLGGDAMVLPERFASRWLDLRLGVRGTAVQYPAWGKYNTGWVTMAGFLHKKYFRKFFEDRYARIRAMIDEHVTGEDMLMSAVHAGPVIGIMSLDTRSKCMDAEHEREIHLGPSALATKEVELPGGVWCPNNAGHGALHGEDFSVTTVSRRVDSQNTKVVQVSRLGHSGWKSNLSLTCCKKVQPGGALRVRVGKANCNTKIVRVDGEVSCARHAANPGFRTNNPTGGADQDQVFKVSSIVDGSGTNVIVTGEGHSGWEMDLGIRCCKLAHLPREFLEGPGYFDAGTTHVGERCDSNKVRRTKRAYELDKHDEACELGSFCSGPHGYCQQGCKVSAHKRGPNQRCICRSDDECHSGQCDSDGYCARQLDGFHTESQAKDQAGVQVALSDRVPTWRIAVHELIADTLQPTLCGTCTWWSMEEHAPTAAEPDCFGTWTQLAEYKDNLQCERHSALPGSCSAYYDVDEEDESELVKERAACHSMLTLTNSMSFHVVSDGPHGCYKYGSSLFFNPDDEVETGHNHHCLPVYPGEDDWELSQGKEEEIAAFATQIMSILTK